MSRRLILPFILAAGLPAQASSPAPSPTDGTTVAIPTDKKVVKALKAWMKSYRAGKYDVGTPWELVHKKSIAKRYGLLPKGFGGEKGEFNAAMELQLLCQKASELNSGPAAQALLEVAAVGLDRATKYKHSMAPKWVAAIGQSEIAKINSVAARQYMVDAANGNPIGPKKLKTALQAAALRSLGQFEEKEYIPILEKHLSAPEPIVRAHAAEGIGLQGPADSLKALVQAFDKEESEFAHASFIDAITRVYFKNKGQVDDQAMKDSIGSAARRLGKGSWQDSITLIDYLIQFPDARSVQPLIDLLVRYKEKPEEIEEGKLSGLLSNKVHFALNQITGAFYGASDIEKWKEFWAREKDTFKPANNKKSMEQRMRDFDDAEKKRKESERQVGGGGVNVAKSKKKPSTVTKEFFGIRIDGNRVVFVIDVSGSMSLPMQFRDEKYRDKALKGRVDRMVVAKTELEKAVQTLNPKVHFNVIMYDDKIKSWQKKGRLVPATVKNKKALSSWIRRLGPGSNTNIYDALREALRIDSLVYGDRFASPVDEVFLLSDGVPNRGAVKYDFQIKTTIQMMNRFSKVRINTVFTGQDNDPADKNETGLKLMQDLAKMTGGKFIRP